MRKHCFEYLESYRIVNRKVWNWKRKWYKVKRRKFITNRVITLKLCLSNKSSPSSWKFVNHPTVEKLFFLLSSSKTHQVVNSSPTLHSHDSTLHFFIKDIFRQFFLLVEVRKFKVHRLHCSNHIEVFIIPPSDGNGTNLCFSRHSLCFIARTQLVPQKPYTLTVEEWKVMWWITLGFLWKHN